MQDRIFHQGREDCWRASVEEFTANLLALGFIRYAIEVVNEVAELGGKAKKRWRPGRLSIITAVLFKPLVSIASTFRAAPHLGGVTLVW